MRFLEALNVFTAVGAVDAHLRRAATTTSSSSATASATPYFDPATIGTFNLTAAVSSSSPENRAFLNRMEEELLPNRTKQARHGSYLREFSQGEPFDARGIVNGSSENIESFMYKFGIAGLVVVQDGAIRTEKYQYGNLPASRNVIQSCTKSFLSTAIGIAIQEGKLNITDRVKKWVPN
ncbi:uncharacterized protein ColSpa_10707 [Colletotrichum spaethianum]|uniref:Beta-lactamase-related domain-containing protein n=1 Tax=Colletotrichum spaethianum TaxID=700344 RepID=A0AA37PDY6_9PEZI|nr:uncharacterized protein ColSpa_10707 [Colletotrichum spaethianum]GKT50526.1 hypothetical protein ColSpa_10707 [Colletotrichum spaethianum]